MPSTQHSTIIEVQVEEAGLQKIRVIDNGTWYGKRRCSLAFERHATSKIKNERDFFELEH